MSAYRTVRFNPAYNGTHTVSLHPHKLIKVHFFVCVLWKSWSFLFFFHSCTERSSMYYCIGFLFPWFLVLQWVVLPSLVWFLLFPLSCFFLEEVLVQRCSCLHYIYHLETKWWLWVVTMQVMVRHCMLLLLAGSIPFSALQNFVKGEAFDQELVCMLAAIALRWVVF